MNETDIANLALGRLGIGQAIASLNEVSTPAKICKRFYTYCRQSILRAHPWGFASRATPIAQVAGQTFPGWQYVYQYPANALMVWAVADASGIRNAVSYLCDNDWLTYRSWQDRYPFKKALNTDGASQVILSDVPSAYAYFTFDVTNTGVYPVDFCGVLADRLAIEIGGPLKASGDLLSNARNNFSFWLSHATAQDMNEQRDDRRPESPSIACRD